MAVSIYYGALDEAGMSNEQTPAKALQAKRLIRTHGIIKLYKPLKEGVSFGLSDGAPVSAPYTLEIGSVQGGRHAVNVDKLKSATGTHVGTHLLSLSHVGLNPGNSGQPADCLYYNDFTHAQVFNVAGVNKLGVEKLKPFFTRGVVLDAAKYLGGGHPLPGGTAITATQIEQMLKSARVRNPLGPGDVVLLRTGGETALKGHGGLAQSAAQLFFDSRVSLVVTDAPSIQPKADSGARLTLMDLNGTAAATDPEPIVSFLLTNGICCIVQAEMEKLAMQSRSEVAFLYKALKLVKGVGVFANPMVIL